MSTTVVAVRDDLSRNVAGSSASIWIADSLGTDATGTSVVARYLAYLEHVATQVDVADRQWGR